MAPALTAAQRAKYSSLQDNKGTAERYKQLVLAGKENQANALVAQNPVAKTTTPAAAPAPGEQADIKGPATFGSQVAAALPPPAAPAPAGPPPPVAPGGGPAPVAPNFSNGDFTTPGGVAALDSTDKDFTAWYNTLNNRPGESNAYGSRTYTTDANGRPIITDNLSSDGKALLDAQNKTGTLGSDVARNLIGGIPGKYDLSSVNGQYGIPTANSADRSRVEGEVYNKLTQDLDQNYGVDRENKSQELANRGIPVGSPAYAAEMDRLDKGYQRAKTEARSQSVIQGGQELQTQFGLGLQSHQTAVNDYDQGFNMPSAVAGSLANIGAIHDPNFTPFSTVEKAGTDVIGAAGVGQNQQQINAQIDQAAKQYGLSAQEVKLAMMKFKQEKPLIAAQIAATNRQGRGGGGGGGAAPDNNPSVEL